MLYMDAVMTGGNSKKVALYFLGMGGGDYCDVYGCSNDRRKPEKAIVMDHVGKLRWYGPKDQKDILKW